MDGLDVVMVIAVILFARLGVRLVTKYLQIRKGKSENEKDKFF